MAYDAGHGQVILFGGQGNGAVLADTWAWDGAKWTQLFPTTSPPPRYGAAMAYDSGHGKVILFGGYNGTGSSGFLFDTWSWDGANWTQISRPPALPRVTWRR